MQGYLTLYRRRAHWVSLHDFYDHLSRSEGPVTCAELVGEVASHVGIHVGWIISGCLKYNLSLLVGTGVRREGVVIVVDSSFFL